MTIAFFTNFISHHQVHVADELYKMTSGTYIYVEMQPMPEQYRKAGYPDFSDRPYVLQAWKDAESRKKAARIAVEADVMLIGSLMALPYERLRCKKGGLTIEISERWFKRGLVNILSPHFLSWYYSYLTLFIKKDVYKLCCSAFTSYDMHRIGAFKNRCYKWAYFTATDVFDLEKKPFEGKRIMWVSRLIGWKHPEMCLELGRLLKKDNQDFVIDIYGDGVLKDELIKKSSDYQLNGKVRFHGNVPNDEIVAEMRRHDIVLVTSDRNEGWGAVVNEAMSNGCVLIGSNEIGSVPYLVKDGYNGFIFKSKDSLSLYSCVKKVIGNPQKCKQIALRAYNTLSKEWSPYQGAHNLYILIQDLLEHKESSILEGPCSKAEIIKI